MLKICNITKSFPGVKALNNVSLTFKAGEIHALVGENGAGKSTLIKIVTGIHQPDEGTVSLNEKELHFSTFRDSLAAGIGIVHQEVQIIPDASVAENIMLDQLERFSRFGFLNWENLFKEAQSKMESVRLRVPPGTLVKNLSAAQKQLIQIARALVRDVKVLLLDEPTSSLTEHEANCLFEILKDLRNKGVALVFVSHKLEEVFAICDSVSVIRDGCLVGSGKIADMTVQDLVKLMIGRTSNDAHVGRLNPDWNKIVLEAKNVTRIGRLENINFKLYQSEVLGFYGLVGSGRTELAKLLIGEDQKDSGTILVKNQEVNIASVEEALYVHRLGYVTENRKEEGLFLEDTVQMNATLTVWGNIAVMRPICHIPAEKEQSIAMDLVKRLQIKTPKLSTTIGNLSGGNQQKVSIAKWLAADCDILIIDEPTVGVDIGAKEQVHNLIHELAMNAGKSIIVISSDMPEIVRLTNRILVFREGRIVGEVKDIDTTPKSYKQVSEEIGPMIV